LTQNITTDVLMPISSFYHFLPTLSVYFQHIKVLAYFQHIKVLAFLDPEGSLSATTVVLVVVVVTPIQKMPKALLIRNGKLRNLAYTFVTSFPTGLPS